MEQVLYWSYAGSGSRRRPRPSPERLDGVYAGWNLDEEVLGEWRESVVKAAKKAASGKLFQTAGHLWFKLLRLNPSDSEATKGYMKLVDKSGGGFGTGGKSPEWIARQNERHADWKNAFEKKTREYELRTTSRTSSSRSRTTRSTRSTPSLASSTITRPGSRP